MKKRTILIAIALLLCACTFWIVQGSGELVTESRDITDFNRVSLSGSGEAIIVQGDEQSLTVETDDNVMPHVITEVKGGTLILRTRRGKPISATRLRFVLRVKDLAGLTVSGSGDIHAERFDANDLEIVVSGSGDVNIDALTAHKVEVRISGSGNVELAGEVAEQEVTISGSGKYRGGDLRSEAVALRISGSGDATLWTTESLDARLSGSGSANYYGNPRTNISSSGSAKIKGLGDK